MRTLGDELRSSGWQDSGAAFWDLLTDLRHGFHPDWSVDDLLIHPIDFIQFCYSIRRKTGLGRLDDDLIGRILLAGRKHEWGSDESQ
jgi:hypothetical protein